MPEWIRASLEMWWEYSKRKREERGGDRIKDVVPTNTWFKIWLIETIKRFKGGDRQEDVFDVLTNSDKPKP